MPVEDFNHYNLRAPRPLLDQLRDFYVRVVGFEQGFRPPFRSFGYWLYAGSRDVVHLTESALDEDRPINGRSTFDHIAFRCSGHKAYEERLQSLGIAYTVDDVPLTGELQYFFNDPAGNGIELNFRR